jgi:release factor glutamine methyltransferase
VSCALPQPRAEPNAAWPIAEITLAEVVRGATARLADAGQPSPRLEAELLLCAAAGLPRATLFAWPERRLDARQAATFAVALQRRLAGEPTAYILGRREFHGLDLRAAPGALIPRPETELLVDWALEARPADAPIHCADVGTGSGAIALAIADARRRWSVFAVEREAAALALAADNRRQLTADNLTLLRGDWLTAFADQSLDLVVGNPPYVCAGDPHLTRGDLRFEPIQALTAGVDGLAAIRAIVDQAAAALRPGGLLLLEHGWHQGAEVRALLHLSGWCGIVTRRDLASLERATGAHPPHTND